MPHSYDYDLIVIGAGSGGLAAAKRAASYGKKVALIENDRTGGTCVIRGCVPKKIMSYAAQHADTLKDAVGYGFNVDSSFDFSAFVKKRNTEIDRLEAFHKKKLEEAGVNLFYAKGCLTPQSPHTVTLNQPHATTKTLTGAFIVLATGGHGFIPSVPGHKAAITSDGIFELNTLPETIAIVGGGYIGVEFASIFRALGSQVDLILRGETLLGGFDGDIQNALTAEMEKRGVRFHSVCTVKHIKQESNGQRTITLDTGKTLKADVVLMATGRRPNSQGLNLEETGLLLDKSGGVQVETTLQAKGPHTHIFAIGDLTNRINLTPVAIRDGRMVADNLFHHAHRTIDDHGIATAVFSTPPVGSVGLNEMQAQEKYGPENIQVVKTQFRPMINTLPNRDEKMFMKAICEKNSGRVVGAHLMGRDAAEMVQFIAMGMQANLTLDHMHATMPLHPTSGEEFVLLN